VDDRVTQLQTLLQAQRSALLSGRLDALDGIAGQLESLMAAPLQGADPRALRGLRMQAETNARLAEAAAQGLRAARRRLTEASSIARGGQTYDGNGRLAPMGAATPAPLRRV
jgi:hypothetical protein